MGKANLSFRVLLHSQAMFDLASKEEGFMSNRTPEVPESEKQLDELKWEVAEELQLDDDIKERGFENMTTREVGKIGGNMVKKLIRFAEKEMAEHGEDIVD